MKAIYFATFLNGKGIISDRRKYVKKHPSLEDFHEWLEDKRHELKKKHGTEFSISKISYITGK